MGLYFFTLHLPCLVPEPIPYDPRGHGPALTVGTTSLLQLASLKVPWTLHSSPFFPFRFLSPALS